MQLQQLIFLTPDSRIDQISAATTMEWQYNLSLHRDRAPS